eukprot:scaffold321_cov67-Phaeocystis_antarctica.AAC.8
MPSAQSAATGVFAFIAAARAATPPARANTSSGSGELGDPIACACRRSVSRRLASSASVQATPSLASCRARSSGVLTDI